MLDKLWDSHIVMPREDGDDAIYIDRCYVHDITESAFLLLRQRGLSVRRPDRIIAVPDHYVPTANHTLSGMTPERRRMVESLKSDAARYGIRRFDLGDSRQGIVHVVGPEQGLTLPGMTIVCPDSHTSTHGALGALAFGIGTTELCHVLATQTLWLTKPRALRIRVDGHLAAGVGAKDLILAIIARIGVRGAMGHAIEYAGSGITALSVEQRLTLCNMSIEAGARVGFIAPDDTVFDYLCDRPYAPKGPQWQRAVDRWRALASDEGARFDQEVALDAGALAPMVTWGTTPGTAIPVTDPIPEPSGTSAAAARGMLDYMGLAAGKPIAGTPIDYVFIGSCTNARIEDLRAAAAIARGRRVHAGVTAWIVPGSEQVRAQAEAEGLGSLFEAAGFEWRHAGCSMCIAVNGDMVPAGKRCASTSNRNFVGRQGPGARTHLMSPAMAAAAAVTGQICDVRQLAGA